MSVHVFRLFEQNVLIVTLSLVEAGLAAVVNVDIASRYERFQEVLVEVERSGESVGGLLVAFQSMKTNADHVVNVAILGAMIRRHHEIAQRVRVVLEAEVEQGSVYIRLF